MAGHGKVCAISEAEAKAYLDHRVRPDCRAHLHVSRREAERWTLESYGPERRYQKEYGTNACPVNVVVYHRRSAARWLENYLVIENMRVWEKRYCRVTDTDPCIQDGILAPNGKVVARGPRLATLQMRA